jgi:hypothetical protein
MPALPDQIARETRTRIAALRRRVKYNRGYVAQVERTLRALPSPGSPAAPAPGSPAAAAHAKDRARLEPRLIRFRGHVARDQAAIAILTQELGAHLKSRTEWADQVRAEDRKGAIG